MCWHMVNVIGMVAKFLAHHTDHPILTPTQFQFLSLPYAPYRAKNASTSYGDTYISPQSMSTRACRQESP